MKRLLKKAENENGGLYGYNIENVILSLDDKYTDTQKLNVTFSEDGVGFDTECTFTYGFEISNDIDESELNNQIKNVDGEEIKRFIESTDGRPLARVINNVLNPVDSPEWQLPTKSGINAWYKPKELRLTEISVLNSTIDGNAVVFTISAKCKNKISNYSELDVEDEEFNTNNVDKNDFEFSLDIMTGEFYR